jgi:predicted aspartyl protease
MRSLFAAVVLFAAAAEARAAPVAETASAVLAANHAAMGDLPQAGAAEFSYAYSGSGLTGTQVDEVDLASGAYVHTRQAGEIRDADGFDGTTPWMRDISGANTPQEGGDRVQTAISEAYRLANLWWRPDHGGAKIVYRARETEAGRSLDRLWVQPLGGKPFDAWFDADTHLLARLAEDRQFFHTRTTYADYRREQGAMLAHTIANDSGAGDVEKLSLTRVIVGPAWPLTAYARPATPPPGGSMEGGASSVTLPFRLLNNHIYLQARVNGRGPYTFMLDTGGHTLLSPHLVAELGLKPIGAAATSGTGEGHSVSGFVKVDDIALGDAHLRDQMGFAVEIYDPAIEGLRVDGMIGFEMVRRFATTIDYGARRVTFTAPDRFDPKGLGQAIPFKFYDHLPWVQGAIDGAPAHMDIDTGSRSEIDVTTPFVEAHRLRARFPNGVRAVTGWGVGGPARSYVVRLPSVTIGPFTIDRPTAYLSESHRSSLSDPNYDGNVGGGLLKRFVVSFDYAHQAMYLKPAVPQPTDVGRFDRSGMWFNAANDGYVIADLSSGGPAQQAGMVIGDLIVAIDGRSATPEGLSDARALLRAKPAGSRVRLSVKRGRAEETVILILRDQI